MKARITYAALEINKGKIHQLDALHVIYRTYVQTCIDQMVKAKLVQVAPGNMLEYFPGSVELSSQVKKCAQFQAVDMLESWSKSLYARKLRKLISKNEAFSHQQKIELYSIGRHQHTTVCSIGKGFKCSQEMLDLYWSWVWDEEISGKTPQTSEALPIYMTEMTCSFGPTGTVRPSSRQRKRLNSGKKISAHFFWCVRASCLDQGTRVNIPLAYNPYLAQLKPLAKSCMAQKRNGRWSFQFVENLPGSDFDAKQGKIGLDVGLNALAATSDGRLYGASFKPKFDKQYKKVQKIRGNRQRQDLKENSPRLAREERRLTGMVKTAVGQLANRLVRTYPGTTFVIEDLDLSGCKGQKRFAYRALHRALANKASVKVVNPAYSSQMCPSCGYINKGNRSGIKFECRSCGRKSHADVVGARNLLRRSEEKGILCNDHYTVVGTFLRKQYCLRRNRSSNRLVASNALKPMSRKFTTKVSSNEELGTASNLEVRKLV